jgi:hypothetical protein
MLSAMKDLVSQVSSFIALSMTLHNYITPSTSSAPRPKNQKQANSNRKHQQ